MAELTWQSLRDKDTGRVKLSAGEVHTIGASQGTTGHLWCNLPDGVAIGMRRGYASESRQRVRTYTVVGEDAERHAIVRERGFGLRAKVTADDGSTRSKGLDRHVCVNSAMCGSL